MARKVLILQGSARKNGNTDLLSQEFLKGAQEAGHEVEKIYLHTQKIGCCLGCGMCQGNGGHCVRKDDAIRILEKMLEADYIVLSSPVYFYSFTGQLKILLDRSFSIERLLTGKTFYMITTGAAPFQQYYETIDACYRNYISCFKDAVNGGIIHAYGTMNKGDAKASPAMQEAYEMGKRLNEGT